MFSMVFELFSRHYIEDYYNALFALGKLYYESQQYDKAFEASEKALSLNKSLNNKANIELLEHLVLICEILKKSNKCKVYTEALQSLQEKKRATALAYAEILDFLEYAPRNLYKKLPHDFISYLKDHSAPDYISRMDPSKPVKQQISEKASDLIAIILTNFWSDDVEVPYDKYAENEEKYRENFWNNVQSAVSSQSDAIGSPFWQNSEHEHKAYYEVDWILQHLPEKISASLSLERLMWLKQRKKKGIYLHDMEKVNPSDYDRETLQLLRYMLEGVDYHTTDGLTDKEKEDK